MSSLSTTLQASSTASADFIKEPIPISLIAGRYLLFDVNVVTYLRRTHHICGVFIGSIPQVPQQNVFLGLPVELQPEEAKILLDKHVAYLVDDKEWHAQAFTGEDRRRYLDSIRSQGLNARRAAEDASRKRSEKALAKQAVLRKTKEHSESLMKNGVESTESYDKDTSSLLDNEHQATSLFNDNRPSSRASSHLPSTSTDVAYGITPTTSYSPSLSKSSKSIPDPPVPTSYPLFAHLHSKDYFIMPGLRFGCNYNVYPGDPLRFHSHFLAVGYDWHQEISMLDLIGGGRLGTAVKKGFLIGGQNVDGALENAGGDNVRTFCVEWGGM